MNQSSTSADAVAPVVESAGEGAQIVGPTGFVELLEPPATTEAEPFRQGCARGELLVQVCSACGALRFPPRPMCAECGSLERSWVEAQGTGSVWSYAVAHPPLLPGYADIAPYVAAVVELDDHPGIRIPGLLVAEQPDDRLKPVATADVGAPVRVVFERRGETWLPAWVATAESGVGAGGGPDDG